MKEIFVVMPVWLILVACATVNYIGDSYPPTERVDLYFSEEDIEKEYIVIGRIVATANSDELFYSGDKFTEAVRKKAREKGADGIVVFGFGKVVSGTSESRDRTEKTEEKGDKTVTRESESVSSTVEEKRRIEALAIKYKTK
ncbi:MAG: hypothetical protein ACYS17_07400 [Planctomycetota bacterium]|jgi:hypothetical protein